MDTRKQDILRVIIEHYIHSAMPIGSKFLEECGKFDVSAPTLRNEMRELEKNGYLEQPHTSAGRIPTEEGYRYYIQHLLDIEKIKKNKDKEIEELLESQINREEKIKIFGKQLATKTRSSVIIAHSHNKYYYTGLSELFSHQEFLDYKVTLEATRVFDMIEEIMQAFIRNSQPGLRILLGSESPFGKICSSVVMRSKSDNVCMLTGPMRMDYGTNLSYIQYFDAL